MRKVTHIGLKRDDRLWLVLLIPIIGLIFHGYAQAFTLRVVDPNGAPIPIGFRWLVEEDVTYPVNPASPSPVADTLALNFHKSYMPTVHRGEGDDFTGSGVTITLPSDKRYFVSVLPKNVIGSLGFTMSGAPVALGQTDVKVTLNRQPVPTAQVSVFVFEDIQPINNAPDLPAEQGLAGFDVKVFDAGGRYGAVGGQQFTDAFGNPFGTIYDQTCDEFGQPDSNPATNFGCLGPDGAPVVVALGSGTILTDVDGNALIKNLAPGKYGIVVTPPAGQGWQQTTTIEGSTTIDAWVKANEPTFFTEFGPPGQHVFVGFVKEMIDTAVLTGGATITGQVVNNHLSRPPDTTFHFGDPVPDAWIGLNDLGAGAGRGIYAKPAQNIPTTGHFTIANVPPGTYELVIWDRGLLRVISVRQVVVPDTSPVDLGPVASNSWFGRLQGSVFYDTNGDGFRDDTEIGLSGQAVTLRMRDGTLYDATTTGGGGQYGFSKVFPFFSWLVAEVDFARFAATGATVVTDAGGGPIPADNGWTMPSFDRLVPQVQPDTGLPYYTEPGEVLTMGIQTFLGQTNVIDWGKKDYDPPSNGGISGLVSYDTTRAENNPEDNFVEDWQPGIPRIQVNLYQDQDMNGIIDDIDALAGVTPADVDNYPFGFSACRDLDGLDSGVDELGDPCSAVLNGVGAEDTDTDGDGLLDFGDAIQVTWTDSWDDSVPTDCPNPNASNNPADPNYDPFFLFGKCYDGLRNYNQVRPAVFDGGYAFTDLASGYYIVEVGQHPVYEVVRAEDKNVDFGDEYIPSPLLLPPPCVGELYDVPGNLNLFAGVVHPYYDPDDPLDYKGPEYDPVTNPFQLPDCNLKQVEVVSGFNAAAEFFLYTDVPPTARVKGFILDDAANEFDPANPNFGEKYAPPLLPVAFRDWTGKELTRVYSDQYGTYNLLVPSTFTANVPNASGFSPAMLIGCMNDPGPISDGTGGMIVDPNYDPKYSQFCYTFQYMPGAITYLDTPVLPVAAFAGQSQFPVDCNFPDGTPVIKSVTQLGGNGPYVEDVNRTLQIMSLEPINSEVPNPAYDGAEGTNPKNITRDFGFGTTPGTVTIGTTPLDNVTWTTDGLMITGDVPGSVLPGSYQLTVTRSNGLQTKMGVTVVVGPLDPGNVVRQVAQNPDPTATPIQDAIDLANPGDLILVAPGYYPEMIILYKDVQLQGSGAPSTIIAALNAPGEKLLAWRQKADSLVTTGQVDLLPFQEPGFGIFEPAALFTEEGAGILVMASQPGGTGPNIFDSAPRPRIDGFTVTGSSLGGGIVLNGYARYVEISNNKVTGNAGVFGGGIRSGHPFINNVELVDAVNDDILIHHNHVSQNGANGVGAGGGVSLYYGTDNYAVTDNYICGNFTTGDGAGIGHQGLSDNSLIARNTIIFNQSFFQGASRSGGGISITGASAPGGVGLTQGSGSVVIDSNIIQGNLAGAGDGGGIRLSFINGDDIDMYQADPSQWHSIDIVNNMIVNNVAGLAGGGISMQDAARPNIINNTIANNESTATAGLAFVPVNGLPPDVSTQQPAGVVSRAHSPALAAFIDTLVTGGASGPFYTGFSNPQLVNNIIRHNRSFYFSIDPTTGFGQILPDPTTPDYWDLAVLPATAGTLDPLYSLLTDITGYDDPAKFNITGDPAFEYEYFNGGLGSVYTQPEAIIAFDAAAAADEGGNFIDVRYSPLSRFNDEVSPDGDPGIPFGDYHITDISAALNVGSSMVFTPAALDALLDVDIDGQERPAPLPPTIEDIGADEYVASGVGMLNVCGTDINQDGDVDGADLAQPTTNPAAAAAEFGRIDCFQPQQ